MIAARRAACLLALSLIAACHKADNASGPGGVSMGEARGLDDAAAKIDAQRIAPGAIPTLGPAAKPAPQR